MWVSARPKEGVRSPGTRVTGHCEIPGMGAENPAQILWENSECSPPLSLLSNAVALQIQTVLPNALLVIPCRYLLGRLLKKLQADRHSLSDLISEPQFF